MFFVLVEFVLDYVDFWSYICVYVDFWILGVMGVFMLILICLYCDMDYARYWNCFCNLIDMADVMSHRGDARCDEAIRLILTVPDYWVLMSPISFKFLIHLF